jgi:4-hydroxybenzoate polyprenyltransferase
MPALAGLLAAASQMAWQNRALDIYNPARCLKLFKSNTVIGMLIFWELVFGGLWTEFKPHV